MNNNRISLSEKGINKCYQSRLGLDQELLFLTLLSGTGLTPEVITQGENSLTLTVADGPTLLESLEDVWAGRVSPEEGRRLLKLLSDWFFAVQQHFLAQTGKHVVLDDPNLRNFIVEQNSGSLVGIDFEYWHYGEVEYSTAMILVYLESYRGAKNSVACELWHWFRSNLAARLSLRETVLLQEEERCRRKLILRRATAGDRRASTAVIMNGGHSTRMGCPKAGLEDGGYTFLERILYALTSFDRIVVSVGETPCQVACLPVWKDLYPRCGPLGGLLTALSKTQSQFVFLTACDTPGITEELILHLYGALTAEDECLIPVAGGHIQPLTGIYRTTLRSRAEALIKGGDYRMRSLLDSSVTHYITLDETLAAQLYNINTPQEYAAYMTLRNGLT